MHQYLIRLIKRTSWLPMFSETMRMGNCELALGVGLPADTVWYPALTCYRKETNEMISWFHILYAVINVEHTAPYPSHRPSRKEFCWPCWKLSGRLSFTHAQHTSFFGAEKIAKANINMKQCDKNEKKKSINALPPIGEVLSATAFSKR